MMSKLMIGKLEAAQRQLATAIQLYFNDADPVSIHALAAAGHNLVADLMRSRGLTMPLYSQVIAMVRPEKEKLFRQKLREAQNFFKHADHDSDDKLGFNPVQSDYLLYEACLGWCQLAGQSSPLLKLFETWFAVSNPSIFVFPLGMENVFEEAGRELRSLSKKEFFSFAMPAMDRQKTSLPR